MEFFDGAVGCCSNFSSKFAKRCISKFFFHCWHFHLAAQKISSSFYFQDTCFISHFLSLIKKTRVEDGKSTRNSLDQFHEIYSKVLNTEHFKPFSYFEFRFCLLINDHGCAHVQSCHAILLNTRTFSLVWWHLALTFVSVAFVGLNIS